MFVLIDKKYKKRKVTKSFDTVDFPKANGRTWEEYCSVFDIGDKILIFLGGFTEKKVRAKEPDKDEIAKYKKYFGAKNIISKEEGLALISEYQLLQEESTV
jgi:hypothetical protein